MSSIMSDTMWLTRTGRRGNDAICMRIHHLGHATLLQLLPLLLGLLLLPLCPLLEVGLHRQKRKESSRILHGSVTYHNPVRQVLLTLLSLLPLTLPPITLYSNIHRVSE